MRLDTFTKEIFKILRYSLFLGVVCLFPALSLKADINHYEEQIINKSIEDSFKILIQSWQEELYFEIYDLGQNKSKVRLSKESFAQRMVEMKWKPSVGEKKNQVKKITLFYRNYGIVVCEMHYEHKTNKNRVIIKEERFPVILEDGEWKFNLKQIIQIPF